MLNIQTLLENETVIAIITSIVIIPVGYFAAKFMNSNSNYDKQFDCTKHIQEFKKFQQRQSDLTKHKEFKF